MSLLKRFFVHLLVILSVIVLANITSFAATDIKIDLYDGLIQGASLEGLHANWNAFPPELNSPPDLAIHYNNNNPSLPTEVTFNSFAKNHIKLLTNNSKDDFVSIPVPQNVALKDARSLYLLIDSYNTFEVGYGPQGGARDRTIGEIKLILDDGTIIDSSFLPQLKLVVGKNISDIWQGTAGNYRVFSNPGSSLVWHDSANYLNMLKIDLSPLHSINKKLGAIYIEAEKVFQLLTPLGQYPPVSAYGGIRLMGITVAGYDASLIDSAYMVSRKVLSVQVTHPKFPIGTKLTVSANIDGTFVPSTVPSTATASKDLLPSSGAGTLDTHVILIDFEAMGNNVPKFTKNANILLEAKITPLTTTEVLAKANAKMVILLPVVLVPGIDPFHPGASGGDGYFPVLENYLMTTSYFSLANSSTLGNGYLKRGGADYPTLATVAYGQNWDSFDTGASNMGSLIDEMLSKTWAASVNIVAHSKGGLVSRYYVHYNPIKVHGLYMAATPHFGSAWAKVLNYLGVNYGNLYPLWRCIAHLPVGPYFKLPPNKELGALNGMLMPHDRVPGDPISYRIAYTDGLINTLYSWSIEIPYQNLTLGDTVVPSFSAMGKDENNTYIPAFSAIAPIPTVNIPVPGPILGINIFPHLGFLEAPGVRADVYNWLTSNIIW